MVKLNAVAAAVEMNCRRVVRNESLMDVLVDT
jgi:hypothetical protein